MPAVFANNPATTCSLLQPDGGVRKTILVQGHGEESPEKGDNVEGGYACASIGRQLLKRAVARHLHS